MALACQHFRSDILWRATERIAEVRLLGKPEVGQLDVAMLVEDNILWFQVSVLHVELGVQVADCQDYLDAYELNLVFFETAYQLEVVEKLSSIDVVHHEVDAVVLLEHELHLHDEWMLDTQHNELLKLHIFNEVLLDQVIFIDALDGEVLLLAWQIGKKHGAKSTA